MAERPIPRPDGDFSSYAKHYFEAVSEFWAEQGLDPVDLTDLKAALILWQDAYPAHVAAQAGAQAAAQTKNAARRGLLAAIRPLTAFVQGFPKTTDADRAAIGITVRDTTPTPTPAPRTRPLVRVDAGQRLQHRLRFVDEASPTRRARPRGTAGAEVWLALVAVNEAPPPMGDHYRFVQLSSRGGALAEFATMDAGKQACYALRWVTLRGDKGPWSEIASATVAA